jgi:hypothetical protein
MRFPFRKPLHAPAAPAAIRRETGFARTPEQVPAPLLSLTKKAAVSLSKADLTGQRAAVYLVLDHSGSMKNHYRLGHVQRLAEQALALSANLDDDSVVPLIYFGSRAEAPIDVRLDNFAGVVDSTHQGVSWGSTNYTSAIERVIVEHNESGAVDPALVIFQTDGRPDSQSSARQALINASSLPMFWAFVGFGQDVDFLRQLNTVLGRTVDNTAFFHAADPSSFTDEQVYDGITQPYARWVAEAARAGVVS